MPRFPIAAIGALETAPALINVPPTRPDAFGHNLTSNISDMHLRLLYLPLPVSVRVSLPSGRALVEISDGFLCSSGPDAPQSTSEEERFQTHR